MRRLVVTGASGYIGASFVRAAKDAGWKVRVLGRSSEPDVEAIPWRLGGSVADQALNDVDAVVHLAHQWHTAKSGNGDVNLSGTKLLLEACRRNKIRRFVMASTISARQDALNHYGREKGKIEQLLEAPGEIAARIGLVYGRHEQAMWGMICRLARLPALPMVGIDQPVQPIAMDELCSGLLALAAIDNPSQPWYGLAAAEPVRFGDVLRTISRIKYGKPLLLIGLPLPLVLFLVDIAQKLVPAINRERVYGLVGLPFVDCAASLKELNLKLEPLAERLDEMFRTRRLLKEGRVLLRYCLGHAPGSSMVRNYVRGVRAYGGGRPVPLPLLARIHPALLRCVEPMGKEAPEAGSALRTNLASRLEMAAILVESDPSGAARMYDYRGRGRLKIILDIGFNLAVETTLFPCRALFQRRASRGEG